MCVLGHSHHFCTVLRYSSQTGPQFRLSVLSDPHAAAATAKSLQSCLTLCDPIDGSPTGSPSLGFSRQEHWSGLPFPSPMHESEKWKVKVKSLSHVRPLATPWTADYQAPLSMGFSRQEYWSGVPLPSPQTLMECLANSGHFLRFERMNAVFITWDIKGLLTC